MEEDYRALMLRSNPDAKIRGIDFPAGTYPEIPTACRKPEWDDATWAKVIYIFNEIFDRRGRNSVTKLIDMFPRQFTFAEHIVETGGNVEEVRRFSRRPRQCSTRSHFVEDKPDHSTVKWLVDGSIPEGGIGFLAGASGSGKTFVMLDLVQSIWREVEWFGRKVDCPGGTYIVASEGAYSIAPRVRACGEYKFGEKRENAKCGPVMFCDTAPDLASASGRQAFLEELKLADVDMQTRFRVPIRFVSIETFAQTFNVRDENSASEVTAATKFMSQISQCLAQPVAVMASHHFGKSSEGMRGSSALRANVDFVIEIRGNGELFQEKIKDAPEGRIGHFDMPIVPIGETPDGRVITSRYVRQAAGPVRSAARVQAKALNGEFVDAFEACAKMHNGVKRASCAELKEALYAKWPQVKNPRSKFARLLDMATAYGFEHNSDWVSQT